MEAGSNGTFAWRQPRATTPDGVYHVLRAAILAGTVRPGAQLREAHIAADLGISRSPLREALTKLEEEGLVVRVPFRGAFVAEVSARDVAEITSIRALVEPYAAELALPTLRGSERPRLMQTIEHLQRATTCGDVPASIDAHLLFHRLFYDCSGHRTLASLWSGWETKLRVYYAMDHRSYRDLNDLAVEHAGLAAIALKGDIDAFRRELTLHFQEALRGESAHPGGLPDAADDGTMPARAPQR